METIIEIGLFIYGTLTICFVVCVSIYIITDFLKLTN